MFKNRVTKTMSNDIRRGATRGQRRRRPELTCLLVTDIESLTGCVLHGIVAPGREAELMGILNPSVSAAAF